VSFCVVELELADGLVAEDRDTALIRNPFGGVNSAGTGASEKRVMEQERRDATRGCLERLTLFFRRPNPGYFWTRPQVLFYGKPAALTSRPVSCLPRFS
jgi:hypothetical protein